MKQLLLFFLCPFMLVAQNQIGDPINGTTSGDQFGTAVQMSLDGSKLIVGSPFSSESNTSLGKVVVYTKENNLWVQEGQDLFGEAAFDNFGNSVSISADGNTIAVGAPSNAGNGSGLGYVNVYEYLNNNWEQIGSSIVGSSGGFSGFSISLSSDGTIVAIGSPGDSTNGTASGQVSIYKNQMGSWVQLGNTINGKAEGDQAGFSVSISNDGSQVAIGAPFNSDTQGSSGQIRIYENQNNNWVQKGSDIYGEFGGDLFGYSVSLSDGGLSVVGGAPFNSNGGNSSGGQARIFTYQDNNWVQRGDSIEGDENNSVFGWSVDISSDGSTILVGDPSNLNENGVSGQARIFNYQNGSWIQIGEDINGSQEDDFFGNALSLSDNNAIAVGAPGNSSNGNLSGQVRVFDASSILSTPDFVSQGVKIFPNPANKRITLRSRNNIAVKNIIVYSILGQKVLITKDRSVNVSNIKSGLYLVKIETTNGTVTKKLVKE